MSSTTPRFVLHTVADHLNYTTAITKEDAARVQDIVNRRKVISNIPSHSHYHTANHSAVISTPSPLAFNDNNVNNNTTNAAADGSIIREFKNNSEQEKQYITTITTTINVSNNKSNNNKKKIMSINKKQTALLPYTNVRKWSAHINELALPKVKCNCQVMRPRLPVQYRKDHVYNATYTPGVDHDRVNVCKSHVHSASNSHANEHVQEKYSQSHPWISAVLSSPCFAQLTHNSHHVHIKDKNGNISSNSSSNKQENNKERSITEIQQQQEEEEEEWRYENSLQPIENGKNYANRTPSVFSHASSSAPIAKLGVKHMTSRATPHGVQAHLAHIHTKRQIAAESTLTASALAKHDHSYNKENAEHTQRTTIPFQEMSTFELSQWLQAVQLHPTY